MRGLWKKQEGMYDPHEQTARALAQFFCIALGLIIVGTVIWVPPVSQQVGGASPDGPGFHAPRQAGFSAPPVQQTPPPLADLPYTDSLPEELGRLEGIAAMDNYPALYLLFRQNDSTLVGVWARAGNRSDGTPYQKIKMLPAARFQQDQEPVRR